MLGTILDCLVSVNRVLFCPIEGVKMGTEASKKPLYIILNPNASKGKAATKRQEVEDCLKKSGVAYEIAETTKAFESIELSYNATKNGYKRIVAAGGDGTVNEVVEGLTRASNDLNLSFEDRPEVAIIPIGRGNDFSFIAKIPKNLNEACKLAVKGEVVLTDYGEFFGGLYPDGRCFVNGVGIGFEPLVNYKASSFKKIGGMLSYILGFIKVFVDYPEPSEIILKADDNKIKIFSQQISICNGQRMGSTFYMAPNAKIDDGFIDVVYANGPIKKSQIIGFALKFMKGTQLKSERFSSLVATEVSVTTNGQDSLVVHADGEAVSLGCASIKVKLFSKQLKLVRKI
jgi:diacylglycerol kinase (ATP)